MRVLAAGVLALLVLPALAFAAPSTHEERRIERLVALPFPVSVATLAEDDAVRWRIDVPEGVAVAVLVESSPGSFFFMRYSSWDGTLSGSPLPGARQSLLLEEGAWNLQVDPLAGAAVRILATFDGRVVDSQSTTSAHFQLFDVAVGCGCVAGVRLP